MEIFGQFKKHTSLALVFLRTGFGAGAGIYKYLSGFFNVDVVLHNSYISRPAIERTYVPLERYSFVANDLKSTKTEIEKLKNQNTQLQATQSVMSNSVTPPDRGS